MGKENSEKMLKIENEGKWKIGRSKTNIEGEDTTEISGFRKKMEKSEIPEKIFKTPRNSEKMEIPGISEIVLKLEIPENEKKYKI